MKRWAWVAAVMAIVAASPAAAVNVGIGMAGGASFSLGQSDNGNAATLALRVPVNIGSLLTIEPFMASNDYGRVEAEFRGQTYNRRGFDIFSYGAIAALGGVGMGPRFPLYPYVGMGGFHMSREGTHGVENLGYLCGIGWGHRLPANFAINARADYHWVESGAGWRRFVGCNLGVTVRFHPGVREEI